MASLANIKYCPKCGVDRCKSLFNRSPNRHDGLDGWCKICVKEKSKLWNIKNNARNIKKKKEYNDATFDKRKQYREINKEKIKSRLREGKDRISAYMLRWRAKNADHIKEYEKNFDRATIKRNRWKTDSLFRLKSNLRSRTINGFKSKGYKKNSKTEKLLGCTYQELVSFISNKFIYGMNWDNQGVWEIDHIIPLASATSELELISLCHYTNLQPLWGIDNRKKSDKIILITKEKAA